MNTAIAAAHNLAWKLAAVLEGWASPTLLDTYEIERKPVGERNVARSVGKLPELTGIAADLGAVYTSSAIAESGVESAQGWVKPGLPAGIGERVPHLWIDRDGVRTSTVDLPRGGMTLLASTDGEAWCEAAATAARLLGVPLDTVVVRARASFTSAEHLWHAYFGIDSRRAVLLRPDGHIAWFTPESASERTTTVARQLARLLQLGGKGTATSQIPRAKRPSRGRRGSGAAGQRG